LSRFLAELKRTEPNPQQQGKKMSIKKIISSGLKVPRELMKTVSYRIRRDISVNPKCKKMLKEAPPQLSDTQKKVLEELKGTGISIVSLEKLFDQKAPHWIKVLSEVKNEFLGSERVQREIADRLSKNPGGTGKPYRVTRNVREDAMSFEDPILQLGLQTEILDVVNSYMGLWTKLVYADVWHTFVRGGSANREASQNWHRDWEDDPLVKVFLYMSDVNSTSGPFEFIMHSRRGEKYTSLFRPSNLLPGYHNYPSPEVIAKEVDKEHILSCCGPTWTLIFCDTSGFHRGGYSTDGARTMGLLTYVSPASACPNYCKLDGKAALSKLAPPAKFALEE
jgi:hypothetical protein